MNDFPRQKLCEIIETYGTVICAEPQRVKGLLSDFCGEYRKETNLIIHALREERIAAEIMALPQGVPQEIQVARLVKRLEDNLGLSTENASWTVVTWMQALGFNVADGMPVGSKSSPPKKEPEKDNYDIAKLKTQANDGDTGAQFELGRMFQFGGAGMKEDKTGAVKWFRKAAERGNLGAQFELGEMYYRGEG